MSSPVKKVSLDQMEGLRKTHFSTDLSPALEGKEVVVGGWVFRIRDKGGLMFIVLQDKFGSMQLTIKKGVVSDAILEKSKGIGMQYCLLVKASVKSFNAIEQ